MQREFLANVLSFIQTILPVTLEPCGDTSRIGSATLKFRLTCLTGKVPPVQPSNHQIASRKTATTADPEKLVTPAFRKSQLPNIHDLQSHSQQRAASFHSTVKTNFISIPSNASQHSRHRRDR